MARVAQSYSLTKSKKHWIQLVARKEHSNSNETTTTSSRFPVNIMKEFDLVKDVCLRSPSSSLEAASVEKIETILRYN